MDLKKHYKMIRMEAAKLDPEAALLDAEESDSTDRTHLDNSQKEIWLVSLENPSIGSYGGRVVSAHPITAARWMSDRTHVLASDEQVKFYKAELERRRQVQEQEEADKRGVPTSKLLEAILASQGGRAPQKQSAARE